MEASALGTDARDSLALLETLFTEAPLGVGFFDRHHRYLRVNETLAEINGVPAEDHVGRSIPEILPHLADVSGALQHVLDTGEPVKDVEVHGETPSRPGVQRTWHCSWYPIRHRGAEVFAVGVVVVEVTDRVRLLEAERRERERAEQAERRSAFLAGAGELLAGSLEWEETLRRVARIAVPAKADLCAVDLIGQNGRLERLVVAPEGDLHRPISEELEAGARHVLETGEPLRVAEGMVVPLLARGEALGLMTFAITQSDRRFDEDDLRLAQGVGRLASMAIENARLYRERDHIAHTLQTSLLPPRLPDVPGFELAGCYRAAGSAYEVGGDFYDVFPSRGDRWTCVVGDVCGKGPEAAALTALARYTLRAGAQVAEDPTGVLALLNDAILRERSDGRFLTAIAAQLDLSGTRPRLDVVAAGHPPGLLVRANGTVEPLGGPGRVLGIHSELMLRPTSADLGVGDVVVLHTDGVGDAGAPLRMLQFDELGRLIGRAATRGAAAVASAIEARALEVAGGTPRDDIALIVLRRTDDR